MAEYNVSPVRAASAPALEINKVLRNTYLLLGLTLAFSAVVATVSMAMNAPYLGFLPTIIGLFPVLLICKLMVTQVLTFLKPDWRKKICLSHLNLSWLAELSLFYPQ